MNVHFMVHLYWNGGPYIINSLNPLIVPFYNYNIDDDYKTTVIAKFEKTAVSPTILSFG